MNNVQCFWCVSNFFVLLVKNGSKEKRGFETAIVKITYKNLPLSLFFYLINFKGTLDIMTCCDLCRKRNRDDFELKHPSRWKLCKYLSNSKELLSTTDKSAQKSTNKSWKILKIISKSNKVHKSSLDYQGNEWIILFLISI